MVLERLPANEQEELIRILEAPVELVRDVSGGVGDDGFRDLERLPELGSPSGLHV